MIEKLNITIQNKLTNQIYYGLDLDGRTWWKEEYDTRGNNLYYEDSCDYWFKTEFNSRGNQIYFEDSKGNIIDDRKN